MTRKSNSEIISISPWNRWKKPLVSGTLAFLGLRIWTWLVLLLLTMFPSTVIPADEAVRNTLFSLENNGILSRLFLAPWYRWDTVHYLDLALNGYNRAFLTVWPPLYPLLIRLVSLTGLSPMVSAVLVGNLCAVLALALLFRMAEDLAAGTGGRILFYLVLSPTAFFLVAAYSESLFILLAAACLWLGHRRRLWLAGIAASLAVLTRLQGVILAVPLLYLGLSLFVLEQNGKPIWSRLRSLITLTLPAALPLLAAAGFTLFIRYGLDLPWPWQTLASEWGQHTGWPWEGLLGNITALAGFRQLTTPINPLAQTVDLMAMLFALACVGVMIYRRKEFPVLYLVYTVAWLAMILVKVDNLGVLVSASRYVLSLFPIFLLPSVSGKSTRSRWFDLTYMAVGLILQAVLLVCFSRWIWIA